MNIKPILPLNQMILNADKPVVEDVSLPVMQALPAAFVKTDKITSVMAGHIEENKGGDPGNAMRTFDPAQKAEVRHAGDQAPNPAVTTAASATSHLFLRFRLINEKLVLLHSAVIDGGFTPINQLHAGGLAFEAVLDGVKLSYGSIADFGETRSYPDLKDPAKAGHFFGTLSYVDIPVRLPINVLTFDKVAKLQLNVYRVKSPVDINIDKSVLFSAPAFKDQLRLVHTTTGLDITSIPAEKVALLKQNLALKK